MDLTNITPLGGVSDSQLHALGLSTPALESAHEGLHELFKRINITLNRTTSAEQNASLYNDPYINAGQYSLAWLYFCLVLLALCTAFNLWRSWTDGMRKALHKEVVYQREQALKKLFGPRPYGLDASMTELETPQSSTSTLALFPLDRGRSSNQASTPAKVVPSKPDVDSSLALPILHKIAALVRYFTYRPTPTFWFGKTMLSFASLNMILVIGAAMVFLAVFCFLPQPYFYRSIDDGSPPLAIRAGMLALSLMPWIIAAGMKVNPISMLTGIGHERLSILHRWGGYLCLVLAIIHTVPFYVQPVWGSGKALADYYAAGYFWQTPYVYGSGLAALVPLAFLCLHSLPILRSKLYELFVTLHIPASIAFLAMLIWHTNNALMSWGYLFATVGIWALAVLCRIFYLNWTAFWRRSWLRGEAATVTVLPENAVKVTVPTQMRWKAGQFVYLRIPELSWLENHPFTVASLCDPKLPSAYGAGYRDMIVVFRPFGGFTRRLLNAALQNGPGHVYRASVDGPHGGMQRDLLAFDTVVFVAGGSGITAVISHLLLLVHKMREESAVTKKVFVIWAMKRPEAADWFREELRICRQFAPENSVHCEFYITAAKKYVPSFPLPPNATSAAKYNSGKPELTISTFQQIPDGDLPLHNLVDSAFAGIADKRSSALVREAADGDIEKAQSLAHEATDAVKPLPTAHITPLLKSSTQPTRRPKANLKLTIPTSNRPAPQIFTEESRSEDVKSSISKPPVGLNLQGFDFGFVGHSRPVDQYTQETRKDPMMSALSNAETLVCFPPPTGDKAKRSSSTSSASFFSPASTFNGKSPDSGTELLPRKFVSPIFYEAANTHQPSHPNQPTYVPYFPPPPSGTAQTGSPMYPPTAHLSPPVTSHPPPQPTAQVRSPVIPQPGQQWQSLANPVSQPIPAARRHRHDSFSSPSPASYTGSNRASVQAVSSTGHSIGQSMSHTGIQPAGRETGGGGGGGATTGWSTEYGRPDIPALLRGFEHEFGRRAAVFVCGPETMRRDVMAEVARMQSRVWRTAGRDDGLDEVYLRVEKYRL